MSAQSPIIGGSLTNLCTSLPPPGAAQRAGGGASSSPAAAISPVAPAGGSPVTSNQINDLLGVGGGSSSSSSSSAASPSPQRAGNQQQNQQQQNRQQNQQRGGSEMSTIRIGGSMSPGGGAGGGGALAAGADCRCIMSNNVFGFLDESSLVDLMLTCKRMRQITTSDDVWAPRLKDMRVDTLLVNRTNNFFRAFRGEIITLRGLEGFYDFESEESESNSNTSTASAAAPVSAVRRVQLTISAAFLGSLTPVTRVVLVVQYFGMAQEDVFEGTMRYSFPKRVFVMATYLTRAPRQEGPRFDVIVARSVRKWGTQKPSHFESVRGGTRLIISVATPAQSPANGYLPSTEMLTVARKPRDGEAPAPPPHVQAALPLDPVGGSAGGGAASSSGGAASSGSGSSSPATSEKRFSFRSLFSSNK